MINKLKSRELGQEQAKLKVVCECVCVCVCVCELKKNMEIERLKEATEFLKGEKEEMLAYFLS